MSDTNKYLTSAHTWYFPDLPGKERVLWSTDRERREMFAAVVLSKDYQSDTVPAQGRDNAQPHTARAAEDVPASVRQRQKDCKCTFIRMPHDSQARCPRCGLAESEASSVKPAQTTNTGSGSCSGSPWSVYSAGEGIN